MSREIKQLRGQLRQITKEILPEVLSQELANGVHKRLSGEISTKLLNIELMIKERLDAMDARSKDIQEFILRKSIENLDVSKLSE